MGNMNIYGHIYYTFDIPLGYMLDEIKEKISS
jgi:hypothetical protein